MEQMFLKFEFLEGSYPFVWIISNVAFRYVFHPKYFSSYSWFSV